MTTRRRSMSPGSGSRRSSEQRTARDRPDVKRILASHSLVDGRSSPATARTFAIALKSHVKCTRVRGLRLPSCAPQRVRLRLIHTCGAPGSTADLVRPLASPNRYSRVLGGGCHGCARRGARPGRGWTPTPRRCRLFAFPACFRGSPKDCWACEAGPRGRGPPTARAGPCGRQSSRRRGESRPGRDRHAPSAGSGICFCGSR